MGEKVIIRYGIPEKGNHKLVGWESHEVAVDGESLITYGVSTCLVVGLHNPVKKVTAMAHITRYDENYYSPENVLDTLISEVDGVEGFDRSILEASLAGEGWLTKKRKKKSYVVREKIEDYGITLVGHDLWQGYGRIVVMYGGSGIMEVYRSRGKQKL